MLRLHIYSEMIIIFGEKMNILPHLIIIFGFSLLISSCQAKKETEKIKHIEPSELHYKNLPLKTSLDSLVHVLGRPQSIEKRESTRLKHSNNMQKEVESQFTDEPDTNWHEVGEIVTLQIYNYMIEDTKMKFVVHNNRVQIMEIVFDGDFCIHAHNKTLCSNMTEEDFLEQFTPFATGTICNKSIQQKQYLFPSNNKRGIDVYETPIFYFEQGKLVRFFYLPDI